MSSSSQQSSQSSIATTFGESDAIEEGRHVYYRRIQRLGSEVGLRIRTESRGAASTSEGTWRRGTVSSVMASGRACKVIDRETGDTIDNVPVHPLRLLPDSLTACKGIDDMVDLDVLHEAAMMENIQIRYERDLIYTKVGPILISVNPYKIIPNTYTEKRRRAYIAHRDSAPHLYGVADDAYTSVMLGKNQSILITGESGAGKTEATKIIIQYLLEKGSTVVSPGADTSDDKDADSFDMSEIIRRRILDSNPILEAFGNAKTIRNDNSSRFGKFFELYCNERGNIAGANITRYLLEKSRVVTQAKGERNYHVFYQLCASKKYAPVLQYKQPREFHYLNQSDCYEVEEIEEESSFEFLEQALLRMGVPAESCDSLFRILAAILHLGNVNFVGSASDYAELRNEESLIASAELLEVSPAKLRGALLQRTMRAGAQTSRSGSIFKVPLGVTEAIDSRDAIAKEIYANIFDLLFKWINGAIDVCQDKRRWIGVLDIFGFEDMHVNSFEQLCINYANEKLHEFFVTHFFELEKRIYEEEGISTEHIVYVDNHACVEMVEARRWGLLSVLDEDCRLKTSTDKSFVEKLKIMLKTSEYFDVNKFDPILFTVMHYAGLISYDATGFLAKNRDAISSDLEIAILSTSNAVLQKSNRLDTDFKHTGDDKGQGASKNTVGSRFRAQLIELMGKLSKSTPHYVRCIKPNSKKATETFLVSMVLQQLRYSGVLESIHIRKAGYASRLDKKDFCDRFYVLCSGIAQDRINDRCKAIINKVKVIDWKDVKIGKSKIFFRRNMLPFIQQEVARFLNGYIVTVQRMYRGYRIRREMIIKRRAIRKIQALGRRWRPYQRYKQIKKAVLTIQRMYRGYRVRKMVNEMREHIRAENRRRQMASLNDALESMERAVGAIAEREAVKIQRAWRAHMERRSQRERLRASLTIQAHWRASKLLRQRKELGIWMQKDILDDVVDAAVQRGEEFYEKLHASAKVIQRYVRYVRRWKREKDAAITIQRATHIFLDRLHHEREEERLRQEVERERKLDALEQELFGKSLAKHGVHGGKVSRGPFRSGLVSLKVNPAVLGGSDADVTANQNSVVDDAFALLLPGRIAFFEDQTCMRQLASVTLARAKATMDEGLLRSDDYHFKIKLRDTHSETAAGIDAAKNDVVFASKTVGDQAKWFKAIMEEVEISKASEIKHDNDNAEESGVTCSSNANDMMQGWLTTQHNSRIFAVRYQGGLLGFHNPSCRDVAVVIPVVPGTTTFTRMTTAASSWFTLNNGNTADMLRAHSDGEAARWARSFPASPTITALKLDVPPVLEGFLGVYQSPQGFATTYGPTRANPRYWRRLYAVLCFTSIRFFEDARCAKAAGELLLHSMYVHTIDKHGLVSTGVDGLEFGFRLIRPGVTQIIVATATSDEARAWIEAVGSLGNGYSGHLTARERSPSPASKKRVNLWKDEDELHHSSDSATVTDGTISSPPRYAVTRSPVSASPEDSLGWKANLHSKLLGSPFWSSQSSPETRRFAMVGLKSEIGLEKQLRRT